MRLSHVTTALFYCCEFLRRSTYLCCKPFYGRCPTFFGSMDFLDDSKLSLTSRIFRTTVSFLSAQFRHKMFVKSYPSPLDISIFFCPPHNVNFRLKSLFVIILVQKRTHVRLFWSEWSRYFLPINCSHATPHFWREPFKRDKPTSRDFVARDLKTAAFEHILLLTFTRSTCAGEV